MAEHPALLYLIDAHSYIYRAYHAISHLSTSHGLPTNAIFGVTNMLLKVLREKRPEYLAMVFDARGPTFRHALLETYKANRPAMPDDLSVQIPYIKDIIRAENLSALELEGYEADDLIATIVKRLASDEHRVVIVSGDKDLLQLVSPYVTIWDPMKDRRIDLENLRKEYGLEPGQMADVFALAGDAIDNVPGVPGIGPKTALSLIQKYRSVENLFTSLESIDKSKLREKLTTYREQALLSKELVTLHVDVPLEIDLSMLRVGPPDPAALGELFAGLEFTKFLKELEPADAEGNAGGQQPAAKVQSVDTEDALAGMLSKLEGAKSFSMKAVGTSPDPMLADISGIALCIEPLEAFYIPLPDINFKSSAIDGLAVFLRDSSRVKAGYNLKYDLILLQRNGVPVSGPYIDVMIAAYLLDPLGRSRKVDSLKMLAEHYLGVHPGDLGGQAMSSACAAAGIIARLSRHLLPDLEERKLYKLFCEVEMPLLEVLAGMEMTGVRIDLAFLARMSGELDAQLSAIKSKIFATAGCEFNINSPKQLGEILFERLNLPRLKKTRKTGSYSTEAGILEDLALYHPLPGQILAYRNLAKLKSTYVDALPKLINPATGRLHTYYNQAVTATGRLSSSEPNLQNIPIRSEEGRQIRRAFITDHGWILLSFDYSQIELRVLAHFAQDEGLIRAFEKGEDVHAMTAAELFHVFPQMVTAEMRRVAKTINFGVVYGMSPFGLAQELRIGQKEARSFIDAYFARYRGVENFIKEAVASAREKGYVRTLLGRLRQIPDINSRNNAARQFAERTAVNTPIQGTAADIIKVAMIQVHNALSAGGYGARMIMQVHDELILEAPEKELSGVIPLVKEKMEKAVTLSVPLVVNVRSGHNWAELE
ncbi:MAG TPA: DNA polymerase I [Proteobacteria bacterium]|nr:DNA polymerase I [Pseudomonadota bacterium]